ncbi:MAG TPA: hypothetical protein VFR67_13530 [Pilimelia sp.]|nr:hypothetical protein [Pilimelia sp.]
MSAYRNKRAIAAVAVPLLAVLIAVAPAGPALAASWSVSPTPNGTPFNNQFLGVDAEGSAAAWAVGSAVTDNFGKRQPIAARWDGASWTLVTTPAFTGDAALESVDGTWAVGHANSATLCERWNGSSWSVVPTPTPSGAISSRLRDVKVMAPDDVWAVGHYSTSSNPTTRTLITRWNGTSWSTVPSPDPDPTQNLLVAVDGVAANDVWAIGNLGNDGYGGNTVAGLVLRWNGSSWTRSTIPTGNGFTVTELFDVAAVASDNVIAVGTAFSWQTFSFVPYVLRWNGQSWQHGTIPNPPGGSFRAVTALSATQVYAFGRKDTGELLIARWNGTTWSLETPPAVAGAWPAEASAVAGTGTVWAVGAQGHSTFRTLAVRTTNG